MGEGSKAIKLIGFVVGVYIAACLSLRAYNLFLVFNPDQAPNPFKVASTLEGVFETCDAPLEHIPVVENVHSIHKVLELIEQQSPRGTPVLFKGYVNDVEKKWKWAAEKLGDTVIRFSNVSVNSFGNVYMPGIKLEEKVSTTLNEAIKSTEAAAQSNHSFFAGFVPFLKGDVMKEIMNMEEHEDPSTIMKADTNFISNFNTDVVSTHLHAATGCNSFSIMMLGVKLWVFVAPEEMLKVPSIHIPADVTLGGSERDHVKKLRKYTIAVQKPGDLLYFPPQWAHAVVTKKGPSVMLNVRQVAIIRSLMINPWKVIEMILNNVVINGMQKKLFNHVEMPPIGKKLHDYRQSYYEDPDFLVPESGCKSTWIDMLYR